MCFLLRLRLPMAACFLQLLAGSGLSQVASMYGALQVTVVDVSGAPVPGCPVTVTMLGFDNNLDQDPGSDRPNVVPPEAPGAVSTAYGWFAPPPAGVSGDLGRNAFPGPGLASLSIRVRKTVRLTEELGLDCIAEAFNVLNRTNVRSVNPNYQRAGEALSAYDPRQIQLGLRLHF